MARAEDPRDVWADCYILMCIEAFDAKAERRLMQTLAGAPGKLTPEEWRESFEGDFSITVDHPPAIAALWEEQKRDDPALTPGLFAQRNRQEIFVDILY
jgi:hypothetical protein